jgi:predicted transcriptional regulator
MQQLTNAEEQLMEHLWSWRKPYERFTQIISRTKTKDHYRGHFTETHD